MNSDAARADMAAASSSSSLSSSSIPPGSVPECSRNTLAGLREAGVFTAAAWDEAMRFCGFTPNARQWRDYWRHMFLLGGALFFAAGVIFFIAGNWADMHRFCRMALVGCLVAGTGLAAVWCGPDTAPGRVLLLSCGICVGPMLAVFGQTYQTGAELWELFRVWTIVLAVLAVAGRQPALWFVTWLSGNVFVMLWLGRSMDSPLEAIGLFSLVPECVLALACAVAAWEWFAYGTRGARQRGGEGQSWLQARWFPRLLFFDLTVRLTSYLLMELFGAYRGRHAMEFLLPETLLPLLAVVVTGISWHWHRKRVPDLFMPACLVSAAAVLLVGALLKMEFLFYADITAVLLWGLLLVGVTVCVAKILLALQQQIAGLPQVEDQRQVKTEQGSAATRRHGLPGMEFFAPAAPVPGWDALARHLRETGLLDADTPLPPVPQTENTPGDVPASPLPSPLPSPWFIRVILAVGGWVASVVLLAFLALLVAVNSYRFEGGALLGVSLVPMGIAYFCLKMPGIFSRNFGFSLALSGAAAACIGLGMMVGSWMVTPFLVAGVLAVLCLIMDSAPFRFLAAACVAVCVPMGIISLAMGGEASFSRFNDAAQWGVAFRRGAYIAAAWWVAVSFALAASRLRESEWLGAARKELVPPVFFGLYGGMMLYLILALSSRIGFVRELAHAGAVPSGSFAVGLGAAAGLLFFVKSLTGGSQAHPEPPTKGALAALGCAALCLPLGWFLPGVALAAFGLALSRYIGSVVMQGATCAFLFAYMVYYYYFLGIPLLQKSLLLGVTGVALLALARAMKRFGALLETEARHA